MYRELHKTHKILTAVLLLALTLASLVPSNIAKASSATVGFESSSEIIYLMDQVEISLTIESDTTLGDFEGNISYDSSVFEYVSGPECIAGGDGMLRLSDIGASSSVNQRSYVMTFKAIGYGKGQFSLVGSPVAYTYEDNTPMSVSGTSFDAEVIAPVTASSNANLASLKISPGSLSTEFSPNVTEYTSEVSADVQRLVLSAVPEDENATVKVNGNQDFTEGSNQVLITVTAESGAKKVYTILVQKNESKQDAQEELETVTPTIQPGDTALEWSFTAASVNGVTKLSETSTYTVVEEPSDLIVPDGYSKTSIKVSGITIPVYQLKDVKEDDFLLMVLQNAFGQTNLYKYDKVEKTIQRYTGDRVLIKDTSDQAASQLASQKAIYERRQQRLVIFIVVLSLSCLGLLTGLVTLFLKYKNKGEDDF